MGGRQINKKQALGSNPLLTNQNPPPPPKENPLAKFFQQKEKAYTPVTESLEQIGLEPIITDINLDDKIVECLVIPVQDLIYKEWRHMTKSELVTKPRTEETDEYAAQEIEEYRGAEVGGPSDVQGSADQPGNGADGPASELQ
jgi:hypothetical protein